MGPERNRLQPVSRRSESPEKFHFDRTDRINRLIFPSLPKYPSFSLTIRRPLTYRQRLLCSNLSKGTGSGRLQAHPNTAAAAECVETIKMYSILRRFLQINEFFISSSSSSLSDPLVPCERFINSSPTHFACLLLSLLFVYPAR